MLYKSLVLLVKCLFYKNLHGRGRKGNFLQLFSLLILFVIPLTSPYSQTLKSNPDSIPFAPAVNYGTGSYPTSVFCADLDADGDLDLAVANGHGHNVSILKNNGDGTFFLDSNYRVGS